MRWARREIAIPMLVLAAVVVYCGWAPDTVAQVAAHPLLAAAIVGGTGTRCRRGRRGASSCGTRGQEKGPGREHQPALPQVRLSPP
jgi:hypothetical protein